MLIQDKFEWQTCLFRLNVTGYEGEGRLPVTKSTEWIGLSAGGIGLLAIILSSIDNFLFLQVIPSDVDSVCKSL